MLQCKWIDSVSVETKLPLNQTILQVAAVNGSPINDPGFPRTLITSHSNGSTSAALSSCIFTFCSLFQGYLLLLLLLRRRPRARISPLCTLPARNNKQNGIHHSEWPGGSRRGANHNTLRHRVCFPGSNDCSSQHVFQGRGDC